MSNWPLLDTLDGPSDSLFGTVFVDERTLVLAPGDDDPNLYVYKRLSPSNWVLETTLAGPPDGFWDVTADPTRDYLAAGGGDGELWVWDTSGEPDTWSTVREIGVGSNIYALAFNGDWLVAAVAGDGGVAYDMASSTPANWSQAAVLDSLTSAGRGAAISPDGSYAALAGEDGTIAFYDTVFWDEPMEVMTDPNDSVWSVAMSDTWLAAGTWRDGIYLYELSEITNDTLTFGGFRYGDAEYGGAGVLGMRIDRDAIVYGIEFSHDGSHLVATDSNDETVIYEVADNFSVRDTRTEATNSVREPNFDPTDVFLASASLDQQAYLYDTSIASIDGYVYLAPNAAGAESNERIPSLSSASFTDIRVNQTTARPVLPLPGIVSIIAVPNSVSATAATGAAAGTVPTVWANAVSAFPDAAAVSAPSVVPGMTLTRHPTVTPLSADVSALARPLADVSSIGGVTVAPNMVQAAAPGIDPVLIARARLINRTRGIGDNLTGAEWAYSHEPRQRRTALDTTRDEVTVQVHPLRTEMVGEYIRNEASDGE